MPCDVNGTLVDQASPGFWLCPQCGRVISTGGAVVARTDPTLVDLGDRPAAWPGRGFSTPGIGRAWLHLPTGSAGLVGVRAHHDHGPIADQSARLLDPMPRADGDPWSPRTAADVDAALDRWGWRVISRAEAATRLLAAGYQLGTNRSAGHLLYADDLDDTTWRPRDAGHGLEAFAAPTEPTR
ncbi:hypothetical protein [Phytohabitans houttuyneae]|uniref:hypothetical protein n=1 Tax=Phytohabitans houttuyneae TaxID=1076126 RepID=UPI001567827B|nr:hypothetical protein [Phytohabitans houttuyneae]